MSNAIEQAIAEAGLENHTGTVLLYGEPNKRGVIRGWMHQGEHAGPVDVDLSRLDQDEAILRSRKHRDMFVFTAKFYEAAQFLIGYLLDTKNDFALRNLRDRLGDAGADAFLEQMGLSEPEPDVGVLEKVVPASGGEPTKQ